MDGYMDVWMDGYVGHRLLADGWTEVWVDIGGCIDGCMDGWTDGRIWMD